MLCILWYILMYYRLIYFDCKPFDFWLENKLFQFQIQFQISISISISATLLKKTPAQLLSCKTCEILKNNYFEEHQWTTASKLI